MSTGENSLRFRGIDAGQYRAATRGQDGRELVESLSEFLPGGSLVLELGSGPGRSLEILQRTFQVTGSDLGDDFLDLCAARCPGIQLRRLDARSFTVDAPFDAIVSSNLLHLFSPAEFESSLRCQLNALRPGGILLHAFWKNCTDSDETVREVTAKDLQEDFEPFGRILKIKEYAQLLPMDSIMISVRKEHGARSALN